MMPVIVKHTLVLNAAAFREETLDGRKYLAVPTVMIKDGVFTANAGALYYSSEENGKSPEAWNGMPLVVGHPEEGGKLVSARKPKILEKSGIGFVFNAEYASPDLKAESWFDVEKTDKVDPRIIRRIRNGETLEVSTGIKVNLKRKGGEFNGEKYDATVHNIRPDHLAVLPDKAGACPVKKGCGAGKRVGNCDGGCDGECGGKCQEINPINNEASYSRIMSALQQALSNLTDYGAYVRDVYSDFFIYQGGYRSDREGDRSPALYKRGYKVDAEGDVTISDGDPVAVQWVQEYRDLKGNFVGNCASVKEPNVKREDMIKGILACNVGYEAADLEGVPDKTLAKMLEASKAKQVGNQGDPPAPEKKEPPAPKPAPQPRKTLKEWMIDNAAPDELHELLDDAAQQRSDLVGNIMKLPNNKLPQKALEDMGTPTLRQLYESLAAVQPQPAESRGRYGNYGLQAVPVGNTSGGGEVKKPKPLAMIDPMQPAKK